MAKGLFGLSISAQERDIIRSEEEAQVRPWVDEIQKARVIVPFASSYLEIRAIIRRLLKDVSQGKVDRVVLTKIVERANIGPELKEFVGRR